MRNVSGVAIVEIHIIITLSTLHFDTIHQLLNGIAYFQVLFYME